MIADVYGFSAIGQRFKCAALKINLNFIERNADLKHADKVHKRKKTHSDYFSLC